MFSKLSLVSLVFTSLTVSSFVQASTMSCLIGVYTAGDMVSTDDNAVMAKTTKLLDITLTDNEAEVEETINGQKVEISIAKRQFTDVYDVRYTIKNPNFDPKNRKSSPWLATMSDWLINEGPAKDNGFQPNVKPGALKFEYLYRPGGTLAITRELKDVLTENKIWGEYPFTSLVMSAQNSVNVAESVQKLVAEKKLKDSDVVGIATAFDCTLNK